MKRDSPIWLSPPPISHLEAGEIHVWRVNLERAETELDRLKGILTADELERAGRFYFERNRHQFIIVHGILRCILSQYLSETPGEIRFQYGAKSKPALANSSAQKIYFNLSHTHEIALYAFSIGLDLGIDVEYMRSVDDEAQLVQRYFSPAEIQEYSSLTQPEQKMLAFFHGWTRKEAFLKAIGEGLAISLDLVEVTLGSEVPAQFLSVPDPFRPVTGWQLVDLTMPPAYCGALAIKGFARKISYWQWTEQVKTW